MQCSTSCGRGVQRRKITCQKTNKDGDTEDVDDDKCSDFIKPNTDEYCNVHNPCPGGNDFIKHSSKVQTRTQVHCKSNLGRLARDWSDDA